MTDEKLLIMNLYIARKTAKDAKLLWQKKAAELPCDNNISMDNQGACYYLLHDDEDSWCDNCKNRTQYRNAFHAAAVKAGVALTSTMKFAKKLDASRGEND